VDEAIALLDVNGVRTLKQFVHCKLDDLDWTAEGATSQGKKVFLRMAFKKVKEETKSAKTCVASCVG
jgi:hypothetical protein